MSGHMFRVRNMSHLLKKIPTSINIGVWERIVLHTGIMCCSLFSQGAFFIIPKPFANEISTARSSCGYIWVSQIPSNKQLGETRLIFVNMKIWTWNWASYKISCRELRRLVRTKVRVTLFTQPFLRIPVSSCQMCELSKQQWTNRLLHPTFRSENTKQCGFAVEYLWTSNSSLRQIRKNSV